MVKEEKDIVRSQEIEMRQIVEYKNCTGCLACKDVCTRDAIELIECDGFMYPRIDSTKCIFCKACKAVCPSLEEAVNSSYDSFVPKAYAAWAVDEELRYRSTSGGVFGAVAEAFIKQGGYVCGCSFSEDYRSAEFEAVNTTDDLRRLIRTKYFQCDTNNIFLKVRRLLIQGEKVLFCGTPCQTAAMYKFVGERRENLYLIDFLCKGMPSQKVHERYVGLLEEKYKSKVTYFGSKSKIRGWGKFFTEVKFENGKTKYLRSPLDSLFVTQTYTVRPACASCNYKSEKRVSDITIGDFWGVEGIDENTMRNGISALIVNTEKGYGLVDNQEIQLNTEERKLDEVANERNPGYSQRVVINEKQKEFFQDFYRLPFQKVLKKYAIKNDLFSIGIRVIKRKVKKVLCGGKR